MAENTDAQATEISRVRAELAAAREETIAWRSAFQRVTPGGSEFTSSQAVREWADNLKMDVFNANKVAVLAKRELAAANERAEKAEGDAGTLDLALAIRIEEHEACAAALSASQEREKALRVALEVDLVKIRDLTTDSVARRRASIALLKLEAGRRARALTQEGGE